MAINRQQNGNLPLSLAILLANCQIIAEIMANCHNVAKLLPKYWQLNGNLPLFWQFATKNGRKVAICRKKWQIATQKISSEGEKSYRNSHENNPKDTPKDHHLRINCLQRKQAPTCCRRKRKPDKKKEPKVYAYSRGCQL
jgi:hypothetical protein